MKIRTFEGIDLLALERADATVLTACTPNPP
jgi:hypothetical protein